MKVNQNQSFKEQTFEPQPLLESRPIPLFSQYGKKRHEWSVKQTKAWPQGEKSPDFIKCPSCGREPVNIWYRKESKKTYRIAIHCFTCGEKSLPFYPRLSISVKRSANLNRRTKKALFDKQRQVLDSIPEARYNQGQTIQEFLQSQSTSIKSLLDRKVTTPIYYVKGFKAGKEPATIAITDYKGELLQTLPSIARTANEAELYAILEATKIVKENSIICSDSKLAVNLVNRRWKTRFDHLTKLQEEIINKLQGIKVEWVPNWKNFANEYEQHK